MEIEKSDVCVNAEDLDVRGNGCLNDCTLRITAYMSSLNYTTRRLWCMGVPNAYRSEWY